MPCEVKLVGGPMDGKTVTSPASVKTSVVAVKVAGKMEHYDLQADGRYLHRK